MKITIDNALAVVVSDSAVDSEIQQMLIERFTPFLQQAADWKDKAQSLVVTDISQTREMKMAREARLALREIRLAADKTRKELKEDSLRYGRAVQGVYNVIEAAISPIEEYLEKQEKFKELYELQQRETLRIEREELAKDVRQYMVSNINFGELTQTDFNNMLSGARLQKKADEEAAIKVEEERQLRIKEEAEERERLRIENEKIRAEAAEKQRQLQAELDRVEMQQRAANIKAAKEKAERLKLEAELKAKEEAELKAKEEAEQAAEAELSKSDKDKIRSLIADLEGLKTKYEFKAKKNKILYLAVISLLDKIITYINQKN